MRSENERAETHCSASSRRQLPDAYLLIDFKSFAISLSVAIPTFDHDRPRLSIYVESGAS